jgi:hypothetical protein
MTKIKIAGVIVLIQDQEVFGIIELPLYFSIGLSTIFPHSVHDPS